MDLIDKATHRKLATATYNQAWEFLEKQSRTKAEDVQLERLAFASLWHWSFAGDASNEAMGEWFLSRVYVSLLKPVEACFHADYAFEICEANGIGDFIFASCLEGKARAHAMLGLRSEARNLKNRAIVALDAIKDPEDRDHILGQINQEPWFGLNEVFG